MRIQSRHGYFIFEEDEGGEIGRFNSVYGTDLVALDRYYTFDFLSDAADFSLIGKPYLGLPAIAMFEGEPWEIMEANKLVYDLELGIVKPVLSVISLIKLQSSDFYYVSDSLIQPGSLLTSGQRIVDYSASFEWRSSTFKYTEIGFL